MSDETIDRALEAAAKGAPGQARELLWPIVRDPDTREEALFPLAYCFEKAGDFASAAYLYGKVVAHHPDSNVAERRLNVCREAAEDFGDADHRVCDCCELRYRSGDGRCPYCGGADAETAGEEEGEAAQAIIDFFDTIEEKGHEAFDRAMEWADEHEEAKAFVDATRKAGRKASKAAHEFAESKPVQDAKEKTREVVGEAGEKLKEIAQSEPVQDAKKKLGELGSEVLEKTKELSEKRQVQEAKEKLNRMGEDASEMVERVAKSEPVQKSVKTLRDTVEEALARIQKLIDRMKG